MATEPALSRKDKKAQRDAERRLKGKKRKISEVEEQDTIRDGKDAPAVSHQVTTEDAAVEQITSKAERHHESASKRKGDPEGSQASAQTTSATSHPKKRRRTQPTATEKPNDDAEQTAGSAKSRFIVFVGNLPYSATDASLKAHFIKLEPYTLRHRTDPKTNKSKGFAFIEFDDYDRMKTCLKLYHHTIFEPEAKENGGSGKGNGKGGRKINVELTSGGGGNTAGRKEKIKAKNAKLEEQRKRRAEAEKKEKGRKDRAEGGKSKALGEGTQQEVDVQAGDDGGQDIHPSRLARIQR